LAGYIDQYYKKVWEGGDLSGGILVAKGDEILYENYRGFGREGNQMPIDKNTPLHVASVSKTLTAMAMMKLVEAGKIKLSDHLTQYFPGFLILMLRFRLYWTKEADFRNTNTLSPKYSLPRQNFPNRSLPIRMY
jgi:CubicO group peptidase (beta-lactamase class C family)